MTTALALGTPGIAVAAILGGMVADPWRSEFLAAATVDVIVFLVAGIASVTLARLDAIGSGAGVGVDWRRNPAWLSLLVMLLAGIAGAALVTSLVAGPAIVTVLGALVPPLLVLGLVAGFDRRSVRILFISVAAGLALGQLLRLIGERPRAQSAVPGVAVACARRLDADTALTIGIVGLGRRGRRRGGDPRQARMRRPRVAADDLDEERWIDRGEQGERAVDGRRRRGVRFGRHTPADAAPRTSRCSRTSRAGHGCGGSPARRRPTRRAAPRRGVGIAATRSPRRRLGSSASAVARSAKEQDRRASRGPRRSAGA